jgi:hypothetical protein
MPSWFSWAYFWAGFLAGAAVLSVGYALRKGRRRYYDRKTDLPPWWKDRDR